MKILLILILSTICSTNLYADASPKLDPILNVEISNEDEILNSFDSIFVIVKYRNQVYLDTLTTYTNSFDWHNIGGISNSSKKNIRINFRRNVEYFNLFVIIKGQTYSSDTVFPISSWSFLEFLLKNDKLIINNSLFYTKWSDYFSSFILTIFLELLIMLSFKAFKSNKKNVFFAVFIVNLITHPILWYIDTNYEVSIIMLEFFVTLIETLLISFYFKSKIEPITSSTAVILANLFSWLIGGVIFWIITQ